MCFIDESKQETRKKEKTGREGRGGCCLSVRLVIVILMIELTEEMIVDIVSSSSPLLSSSSPFFFKYFYEILFFFPSWFCPSVEEPGPISSNSSTREREREKERTRRALVIYSLVLSLLSESRSLLLVQRLCDVPHVLDLVRLDRLI